MPEEKSRLVYSTDGSGGTRIRPPDPPKRQKPVPARAASKPPADGTIRIQREKKGRGGKTVTIVTGLRGSERDLDALLTTLKQLCGSGGTREDDALVIQGDHRERVKTKLESLGHRVLLAGG
ncbi:MAG: translation initiation factor [Vicinamibacterales bacterium]